MRNKLQMFLTKHDIFPLFMASVIFGLLIFVSLTQMFSKEKPLFKPYSKSECVEWCSPWAMKQFTENQVSWSDSCVCGENKN
jgi:hypothetical protein